MKGKLEAVILDHTLQFDAEYEELSELDTGKARKLRLYNKISNAKEAASSGINNNYLVSVPNIFTLEAHKFNIFMERKNKNSEQIETFFSISVESKLNIANSSHILESALELVSYNGKQVLAIVVNKQKLISSQKHLSMMILNLFLKIPHCI